MADDEVRIEITKGYDEKSYCDDLGITTTQEAEDALTNFDETYQQYQDIAEGNGMDEERYRKIAESTLEKFKNGEFPAPARIEITIWGPEENSANGNTKGIITGQPPASAKSAEESNPEVTPETPEEEREGSGWLDGAQLSLDAAGLIPGFGAFFDVTNAGVSLCRGDFASAAFSLLAAIPVVGDAAAAAKMARKGVIAIEKKAAKEVVKKAEKEVAEKAAGSGGKIAGKGKTPKGTRTKNRLPEGKNGDLGPSDSTLDKIHPETGELQQSRRYDIDGKPTKDIDYGHDHGAGDPHVHDWSYPSSQAPNKTRGPGRPLNPGEKI